MKDKLELPQEEKAPIVRAYVLINYENDYTNLGQGSLEIITDTDMAQSQHYIEVTSMDGKEIFFRSRLQPTNVYERQKNTVILWNDPEQTLSNSLGITFEDPAVCDKVWRLICSKIGKNYLEIHGEEKLEMPNEMNISTLHEKIKTAYNLVAYHLINSSDFMKGFLGTLETMNRKESDLKSIQILRDLFSNFDPKLMETFLSDPNFDKFLQFYESKPICNSDESHISFGEYYKKLTKAQRLIEISPVAQNHIELSTRAKFVKEGVIDYAKDAMMEGSLDQVIKDNEIEALIEILQKDSISSIIEVYEKSKNLVMGEKRETNQNIITFFLEAALILQVNHADNAKISFLKSCYSSGIFKMLGELISDGYSKALEILSCFALLDPHLFKTEFTNDFRNNSNSNLIRLICKQFSENPENDFVDESINFLISLKETFDMDRSFLEFINKTMVLFIFSSCKYTNRVLALSYIWFSDLNAIKSICEHIIKFNFFQTLAERMRNKMIHKNEILIIVKIIGIILELNKPNVEGYTSEELSKMNSLVSESGIFEEVLKYLKENIETNNLLTSSILKVVGRISELPFNELTEATQKFMFGDLQNPKFKILTFSMSKIYKIKDKKSIEREEENEGFDVLRKKLHRHQLEDEEEENYLQEEEKSDKVSMNLDEKKEEKRNEKENEVYRQSILSSEEAKIELELKLMKEEINQQREAESFEFHKKPAEENNNPGKDSIGFDIGDIGHIGDIDENE